jgi:hypothetical protein
VWGGVFVLGGDSCVHSVNYDSWPGFVFAYVFHYAGVFGEEVGDGHGMWFKVGGRVTFASKEDAVPCQAPCYSGNAYIYFG